MKKTKDQLKIIQYATRNGGVYESDKNQKMGMYKLDKIRSEIPE